MSGLLALFPETASHTQRHFGAGSGCGSRAEIKTVRDNRLREFIHCSLLEVTLSKGLILKLASPVPVDFPGTPVFWESLTTSVRESIYSLLVACEDRDRDLPGMDLKQHYNVMSLVECQGLCQLEPQCTGAVYDRTGAYGYACFLKHGQGNNRHAMVGISTIPKVCQCLESNVKYNGPGMISSQVGDVFKCQGICQGTAGCKVFSYDVAEKLCFVLSEIDSRGTDEGTISGLHDACN